MSNALQAGTTPVELDPKDIFPCADLPQDEEFGHLFTANQLASVMRNRTRNGLSMAVVVIGNNRLYFSRTKLRQWLASRLEKQL